MLNFKNYNTSDIGLKKIILILLKLGALSAIIALAYSIFALPSDSVAAQISWFTMITHLSFGLGLFLFGMEIMGEALNIVAGDSMKLWLKRFTHKPIYGLVTGGVVTAIIQSSSVTTVLLIGFVSAEIMTFARAIAVLYGANIGTTITAQMLASFKIIEYAPLIGSIGFILILSKKNDMIVGIGKAILGLALIFFGMGYMSEAMQPLREFQPFLNLMVQMNNPLLGLLVAAVFTALIQSSSATMGMIVVFASNGLITIDAGIALAFGANVGTCVTAGLAAMGKTRPAVRVAMVHIIFNVVGALLFIGFIPQLSTFVTGLTPNVQSQVANAHTIFNVVVALIFLPFTRKMADFTVWMLPDLSVEEEVVMKPKYLLSVSEMEKPMGSVLALTAIRKEIYRMGKMVREMYIKALPAMIDGTKNDLLEIREMDNDINILHNAILHNIHTMRHSLHLSTDAQMKAFGDLWSYPDMLESIADIVKHELINDGLDRLNGNVIIGDNTKESLQEFHKAILKQLTKMLLVIKKSDTDIKEKEIKLLEKQRRSIVSSRDGSNGINIMQEKLNARLKLSRLESGAESRMGAYTVEDDMITHLRYIFNAIRKMAKVARPKFEFDLHVA